MGYGTYERHRGKANSTFRRELNGMGIAIEEITSPIKQFLKKALTRRRRRKDKVEEGKIDGSKRDGDNS